MVHWVCSSFCIFLNFLILSNFLLANRCTIRVILISLDPYTSQHLASVGYLVWDIWCGIFGVWNEATGEQVNYLIDEALSTAKGTNLVISVLHHYLESHPSVSKLILHADNCWWGKYLLYPYLISVISMVLALMFIGMSPRFSQLPQYFVMWSSFPTGSPRWEE